jgi:hypothetical protein
MQWTRAITTTVTIALMAYSNGAEAGALPRFPKGTPYAEARQSLKALGDRLNALPDADDVSRARCGYNPTVLRKRSLAPEMPTICDAFLRWSRAPELG